MMYHAAQIIVDKCKKYGLDPPINGEYWESSLIKILSLINYLEGKITEQGDAK